MVRGIITTLFTLAAVSTANASDVASSYREISESWLGGEMYVRCGDNDFKIIRDIWQRYSVEHLSRPSDEWLPMVGTEATDRSVRFWFLGVTASVDESIDPLKQQLFTAIEGRSTDGGFAYAYNYRLMPESKEVVVQAELDAYDGTLRIFTAEQADFIWNFDDSAEYSVPATVPRGTPLGEVECEAR